MPLGIEMPFPALAVETTKDPLVAASCFWATKVLLVTNTSFLVYKLRARANFQRNIPAQCGMSLIAIGRQYHQVVHLKCWIPKIIFWAGEKSPERHSKNKWRKFAFFIQETNFFCFGWRLSPQLCVLAPVLMVLYISSAN